MKKASRFMAILLSIMLFVPNGVVGAQSNLAEEVSSEGLQQIASEKAELLTETYGTTSVQYALIDNGNITVSGQAGVNDLEGKNPLNEDTMYGIGSTSKVFTTAAVMKLVDERKIDLDAPLIQYIPDFKMADERYKQITPRMLLNHSSGLQGSSLSSAFLFEDNDSYAYDTLLTQLSTQELKADPGAFSVYCNDGFTLAEILVERVSGMSFTEYLHQHITEPLDMDHTKTPRDSYDLSGMAALYYPGFQTQLPHETTNVIGTGGIYSTAEDLVKFGTLFTGEQEGILSEASIEAMEQEEYKKGLWPEDADNIVDYGLGWDSVRLYPFNNYGIQSLTKGGDTIFYHASLVVLPEQNMAAAVLSSGGSSSLNQLLASEILLHALKEKGVIQEFKPEKSFGKPVKAEMPVDTADYSGYYGATNVQYKAEISSEGELSITVPSATETPALKYVYTSDGTFVSEDGSTKVSFVKEDNDRTYLWVRQYVSVPGLGQLALSEYSGEKLLKNELDHKTAAAWKNREGKAYYPLNEKYSSVIYLIMSSLNIDTQAGQEGYYVDKTIVDSSTAKSLHHLPAMGSRDTAEYRFYKDKGSEYMESAGSIFISQDDVKPLYKGKKSKVTLQKEGYAKWFTVPEGAAGKTMTVELPAKGAFAVYNELGQCVHFSLINDINSVPLPENGTIVFAGEPYSSFSITLK